MRVQLHFFSFVLSIICSPTKPLSSCSPLPCPVCVQLLFLSFMLSIICSQIKQSSCRSPSSSLQADLGLLYFCVYTHKHTNTYTHIHTQAHTHTHTHTNTDIFLHFLARRSSSSSLVYACTMYNFISFPLCFP